MIESSVAGLDQQGAGLLFLQICIMLAMALVGGQVVRHFRQPAVLGELLAGILLGPTILGALAPAAYRWLFPHDALIIAGREMLIRIGMLFFLFVAGLEVNLGQLKRRGLCVVLTSGLGNVFPFVLGAGAVLLLPRLWQPQGGQGTVFLALFIGTALSISALPVIARILMDLDLIRRELGVVVMTAATINDLIGWSLFAVLLSLFVPGGPERNVFVTLGLVAALALVILGLGRWLISPALRVARASLAWPSGFIAALTVGILAAAALAESMGIHAIFGAFLVGVALGQGPTFRDESPVRSTITHFAVSFFAPLYFVSVGLRADFAESFDLTLVLLVLVIATVGKVLGAGLGARLGGMSPRSALAVGIGLNARGAIEIVLASVALEHQLIDQRIFVALVIMALVTSMVSGPLLQRLMRGRGGKEGSA